MIAGITLAVLIIADAAIHTTKDSVQDNSNYLKNQTKWWQYLIYYDPNDERNIVPRRFGVGITFNFARPLPKIIAAAFILYIVLHKLLIH